MNTPEGRATYNAGTWTYEFDYKDHLGNTRVSFKANGSNLEKTAETAFDPWGVRMNIGAVNAFQNRFEFLNRQKESTFGLNTIRLGARGYNPTIGRFDAVDEIIDGQEQYSTYQYGWNNPILRSDPDGRCPLCPAIPFIPEISAGLAAAGAYIAGTSAGILIAKAIENNSETIARGMERLAASGAMGGEHQYATWARELDPSKSNSEGSKSSTSRGSEGANNKKKGDDFEKKVTEKLKNDGHEKVGEQITIKPNPDPGGQTPKKVKLDDVSMKDGKFKLTDAKSSATAPNTPNQKAGYPLIERNGGTVVGKGAAKKGYPEGTKIPPTKVDIIRPNNF
jgi:RHS repeat-associated protein